MAVWRNMKSKITTSVRTTHRMNTLLNESIQSGKKKPILKIKKESIESEEEEEEEPKLDIVFLRTNFNMEKVYKLLETTIEERFQWDRSNRAYDPWKSVQLVQSLASDIKDKIKQLKYKRHRIVCIMSILEKRQQGVDYKMAHLMDPKTDNYTTYTYERASYFIIATVFLVHKD